MTQFQDDVQIDGNLRVGDSLDPISSKVEVLGDNASMPQMTVRGAVSQAQPLQVWEDSSETTLLEVTEDGRFKVGDDQALQAEAALIEVYREGASTSKPQRGINTLGTVEGAQSNPVDWVAHELELSGNAAISSIHSAVRGQLTHQNAGDSSGATLRGGDFQVVNEVGASGTPVGQAVGLHAGVSNEAGAYLDTAIGIDVKLVNAEDVNTVIDTAIGIEVADVDQGDTDNFAIRTGLGTVLVGDKLEVLGDVVLTKNPGVGKVLTSDANGNATWEDATGGSMELIASIDMTYLIDAPPIVLTQPTGFYAIVLMFKGRSVAPNQGASCPVYLQLNNESSEDFYRGRYWYSSGILSNVHGTATLANMWVPNVAVTGQSDGWAEYEITIVDPDAANYKHAHAHGAYDTGAGTYAVDNYGASGVFEKNEALTSLSLVLGAAPPYVWEAGSKCRVYGVK